MKNYFKLLLGLVIGFTLILLNSNTVLETLINVLSGFNPTTSNSIFVNLITWISRGFSLLSFAGIITVIVCIILIIKKLIFTKEI